MSVLQYTENLDFCINKRAETTAVKPGYCAGREKRIQKKDSFPISSPRPFAGTTWW